MALRDGLTGLYNRRYLEDAMIRELNRAERNRTAVSVIMIDIDHFKRFTDKFGHAAGDFVLNAVARTIASSTRASDIACRYGGEAPAVMLADADLQSARERAEQMRQAIRGIDLSRLGQKPCRPQTASSVRQSTHSTAPPRAICSKGPTGHSIV